MFSNVLYRRIAHDIRHERTCLVRCPKTGSALTVLDADTHRVRLVLVHESLTYTRYVSHLGSDGTPITGAVVAQVVRELLVLVEECGCFV